MRQKKPTVSVVIPVLNEAKRIAGLVESLSKQTYLPQEILVVDSRSEDTTANVAKSAGATVLQSGRGVARQRNHGGHKATGELIFFMDADVTLKPDFIERCVAEKERRNLSLACPHYWPYGSTVFIKFLHLTYNLTFWTMQKLVPSGGGSCIIATSEVFRRSGGFNEALPFEDMQFLRQAGKYGKFGFIKPFIGVSDRRFKHDGVLRTALLYALLTPLFILNLYGLTRFIRYNFGHYEK